MKIKTILTALAVAVMAAAFTSCSKIDTGADAGGYSMVPTVEAKNNDAIFIMRCHEKMMEVFGSGIVYKNSANDQKAIAACDKVFEEWKYSITISFELCFKTAVGQGETPKKTVVKTYKPAN